MTENVNRSLDLGRWLGRHEAFGLVAGRCSAAEVESLRRIRDSQLYLETSKNWEEFCVEQLQSSRRKVDREIRLLEEFGPAYFQLAQVTRISPEDYRAIQANVTTDGLRVDGELVVFRSENHQRIKQAVTRLKSQAEPAAEIRGQKIQQLILRCKAVAAAIEELGKLESPVRGRVALALREIDRAARGSGLGLPGVAK